MNEKTKTISSLADQNSDLSDNKKEYRDGNRAGPELALGGYKEGDTGFIEHSVLLPSAAGVLPNSFPGSILLVAQLICPKSLHWFLRSYLHFCHFLYENQGVWKVSEVLS